MDKINAKHDITILLNQLKEDDSVQDKLLQYLYGEMYRMAAIMLSKESKDLTFQATELVSEVYLKLFDGKKLDWNDRKHFIATSVLAMRRILVDHARKKIANKRIDKYSEQDIDETFIEPTQEDKDIVLLDEALSILVKLDKRQAKIVELKYFAGFTEQEIADLLGVTRRTITREWRTAKLWLKQRMYS